MENDTFLSVQSLQLFYTYSWSDGQRYHGDFTNGAKSGTGTFIYPDGSTYKGDVKEDMFHGKGMGTKCNLVLNLANYIFTN